MSVQIVLVLSLFFVSLAASADLGKKVEDLNATVKSVGQQPAECTNCYGGVGMPYYSDTGSLMRSCVESICSKQDSSLANTLDQIYKATAKTNSKYDKEIQPLIEALSKEQLKDAILLGNSFGKWLVNPPDLKSPGGIRIFNLFKSIGDFEKFQFVEKDNKMVVDLVKSRSAFPQLSDDEFKKTAQIGDKILDAFLERAITETDPARIQLTYGNQFKEKVEQVIRSIEEKSKQIESDPDLKIFTQLRGFKEMVFPISLKEQLLDFRVINPNAIASVNRSNSLLNLFIALSKDPEFKKILDSPLIDMKKAAAKLGTDKILKDRADKAAIAAKTKAVSAKCRTAFEMANQVLPSQKEIDAYKAKVAGLKSQFLDKTKSMMCESASGNYQSQVSSWTVDYPLTKEQHVANMKGSLSRALGEAKKWEKQNEEIDKSPSRDAIYAIRIATMRPAEEDASSLADDVCDDLMTNLVPDATSFLSTSFVAGPLTIKDKNLSGISYHELAHKLFHFMKHQNSCPDKSKFANTRACLFSMHTELSPDEINEQVKEAVAGRNTKYESEDWADLISAQMDDKSTNFACLFAKRMNTEEYYELSLRSPDSSDVHSSHLFRLLHINFLKTGKTPVQCEQALAARGEKPNFRNCLQE